MRMKRYTFSRTQSVDYVESTEDDARANLSADFGPDAVDFKLEEITDVEED